MTGPTFATLGYRTFQTSGPTINWGNAGGVNAVAATSTGTAWAFSIHPKVAAGQNVAPGKYTETITTSVFGCNDPIATFTGTAMMSPICTISANSCVFGI